MLTTHMVCDACQRMTSLTHLSNQFDEAGWIIQLILWRQGKSTFIKDLDHTPLQ